jgi:hypothetical protein
MATLNRRLDRSQRDGGSSWTLRGYLKRGHWASRWTMVAEIQASAVVGNYSESESVLIRRARPTQRRGRTGIVGGTGGRS